MTTQYNFNSRTQSGTITVDNRFITIQSSNFFFGVFRIRTQNQTLPLQALSQVSSGLRYRRKPLIQGAFLLLLSLLTTIPGLQTLRYGPSSIAIFTLCIIAIIFFTLAVILYGHSFSSPKLNPSGIRYIIFIFLIFYVLVQLFISNASATNILHIILFSLGIMILMKSLQAALSIQQCGTKPVVLGINSQDISIVQDMEKSIIHSLNYNIDKTNLNSFFDRKY